MKNINSTFKQNLQIALILTFALTCTGAVALSNKFRNEIFNDLHNIEGCLIGNQDDYKDEKFPGIDEYHFQSNNFDRSPRIVNTMAGHNTYNPTESYSEANPFRTYHPLVSDIETQPTSSSTPSSIFATAHDEKDDDTNASGSMTTTLFSATSNGEKRNEKQSTGVNTGLLASNDGMTAPFSGSIEKVSVQNTTNLVPPSGDPDMNEAVPVGGSFETLMIFIGIYAIIKFYFSTLSFRRKI